MFGKKWVFVGTLVALAVGSVLAGALIPSPRRARGAAGAAFSAAREEAAAVGTLAMSGDALTAEAAAGETVASELGE